MNFLITGGCGYIGSRVTQHLLKLKHRVLVYDSFWFGNSLKKHKNLKVIKGDVRNFDKLNIRNIDTIIHLANVANDPTVELNPTLSWEINVLAAKIISDHAINNKVKKLIFFSSGSVYGLKKEKKVTEDLKLNPISVYNKTKMIAERVFLSFQDKMDITCLRPATVCGVSDRLRLDVTVNKLTFDGFYKGKIFVDGGKQVRPNIHIEDIVRIIDHFALSKKKFKHNIYNIGFENLSILQIANMIKDSLGAKIIINKSKDIRSYRQDSSRLLRTGFKPKYNVDYAIQQLTNYFKNYKSTKFGINNFNLKKMKKLNIK
ncbi:SDR family oxidoreductase [Pelagibacteraceae bacterium]|jgi:nucleoside-diphosphate-sugar epimerase|nr:SDR family oxidoreductase [Pelagibacteraceae bacterium]